LIWALLATFAAGFFIRGCDKLVTADSVQAIMLTGAREANNSLKAELKEANTTIEQLRAGQVTLTDTQAAAGKQAEELLKTLTGDGDCCCDCTVPGPSKVTIG
jgi:hypothetical protein